ncbi:hypothetical protein M9M90_16910 [Phenylobacterium sp. LH3H17]|uniref:hypothetical protein n=1 Tax=Phenylobacterium sp. LH3H17 TaxID=2903901 RepID=UPI0020C9B025|nr:hypothetical protein [Phenylobacterium sp. LH3H17]UTP38884.1 hypothetical protein M9M90_16910 [Phenylobacterium sp. LH3H17]
MSGSYARGGQPRSVPDPDAEDYAAMVERQKLTNAKQEAGYWSTHPGLAESFVPVWGSAPEAIADAHEGDIVGAVGNGLLAVTDLAPGAFVAKGMAKGGLKAGSHTWKQTRRWMGKQGMLAPGQHGHHGIIPQGGWRKSVPTKVKNQPWNITGTATPETHGRIHGRYSGKPQFTVLQQYRYGTPNWAKATHVWVPNGGITAFDTSQERARRGK